MAAKQVYLGVIGEFPLHYTFMCYMYISRDIGISS